MKITNIRTFLVHPGGGKNWLFVKVETDEGIHGWGECYTQADRDRAIETHVHQLGRYLVGRSPFNIKHFTFMAYHDFAGKRGAMDLYCAVSGIEHALWDIVGKALNTPVYNLLGGACRGKIRVYANGWGGRTVEERAERAVQLVEQGFTAMKFDPFPGPWRTHISRADERAAVECVRAVRDAVGPDIELLVEVHRRLAPVHAIRVAKMMEEFHPFWYEEPVSARNIDALAEVRHAINLPVVTGEELYTKAEFREVFEKRAADILNPDVCNCGGILELKEIAAMAEPYFVVMAPHNYNSTTIGLAATVQACAVMSNFLITEYFVSFTERGNAISMNPLTVENGYIQLPTAPGLGLDLDEAALAQYPYREFSLRHLRQFDEEGP
ncbi:MAG: mandelate racemase/muconate lactonizing enzyme family protein [Candidatus Poribacteria bacterium]|nr:mandelate racemase/muconate lactonizing enzyme family protein [Candidatus Poribacteria bacterium]